MRKSPLSTSSSSISSSDLPEAKASTTPAATSPLRPAANAAAWNGIESSTPNRTRLNSRDIPRSYSGHFGQGDDDLLPFELSQSKHTDWLENGGPLLLATYVGGILLFELVVTAVLDAASNKDALEDESSSPYRAVMNSTWTITHVTHLLLSTIYLHWLKGSVFDNQGEMAAMTLWEQLEGRPQTLRVKRTLTVVPTLLCYAACYFSDYDYPICVANIVLWMLHMMGKLPVMNGVRIFGINATPGMDDHDPSKKEL